MARFSKASWTPRAFLIACAAANGRSRSGACRATRRPSTTRRIRRSGAQDPETFLHSLDCFVYRTSDAWMEGFGRVVVEAMASGLPVVCGDRGGYADFLAHGRDSMLFASTAEALETVRAIRANLTLARSLGANASRAAACLQRNAAGRTLQLLLGRVSDARVPASPRGADPGTRAAAD